MTSCLSNYLCFKEHQWHNMQVIPKALDYEIIYHIPQIACTLCLSISKQVINI